MRLTHAAAAGLLGSLVLGCGPEPTVGAAPPPALDTLVVGVAKDATDLLSPLAASSFELALLDLIAARPLDPHFRCEQKFNAELAESWQWSTDGLTLDVRLRDDLRWEDGTPVTAADLALASTLANTAEVGSRRGDREGLMEPAARPEVINPRNVRYRFRTRGAPSVMLEAAATLQVVPSHLLGLPGQEGSALRRHPLNAATPLASGPWRVAKWEKDVEIVLEPNPGFPKAPTGLRRVVFKVIPDYAARLAALQGGTIDLLEGVQVSDADTLAAAAPGIRLARRGYRSMDYVGWNQVDPASRREAERLPAGSAPADAAPHPLFADVRVRTALTTALDIDKLMADTLTSSRTGEVYATRATGTITPELCGIRPEITPIVHSTDEAKRLLGEAGWEDSNGDGVVDKAGVEFRFTLLLPAGSPRRDAAAALIQTQLRAAGVDAQLETLDSAALLRRMVAGDFDAVYSGWTSGLAPDPGNTFAKGRELNFTSFSDPEMEALFAVATAEPDPVKANERWAEAERRVYAQQPYSFLFWVDEIVAVDGRFENTRIDLVSAWNDLGEWTVPANRVRYVD